jgi:hypothetical protein
MATAKTDADALQSALEWLGLRLDQALRRLFETAAPSGPDPLPPPGSPEAGDDPYSRFVREHALDPEAQILLLLALAPAVRPDFFDRIINAVLPEAGDYPLLGGVRGRQHRGFLPTGDTALLLLAGTDLRQRLHWQSRLLGEHPLIRKVVLYLDEPPEGEPLMSGRLILDADYAERILTGRPRSPRLSFRFPAQRLETRLGWQDLVLPQRTAAQIQELRDWVLHEAMLMDDWGMRGRLRPGCRALFFGPPGTGKTFTATLLGKVTGREVYQVDLSMVISKYIGETEKHLAALFDKAEHKDWILFFDEADALFGKRTQLKDSHDRYANQEVSFLLQRVETFDGLVILASNLSTNVDEAFARRFEHMIHFPMPRQGERRLLWQKGLPEGVDLEPGVSVAELATRHELSGGMIMNVVRHASLRAIARGERLLRLADLSEGIKREYAKENRLE